MKIQRTTKEERTEYQKDVKISVNDIAHYLTLDQLKTLLSDGQKIIAYHKDRDKLLDYRKHLYDSIGYELKVENIDKYLEGRK